MRRGIREPRRRRGRPRRYGKPLELALQQLWVSSGHLCSKRLAPFLLELLATLDRHGEFRVRARVHHALQTISPATIDRLLKPHRRPSVRRPLILSPAAAVLRRPIPLRTFGDWHHVQPGALQADLVAHLGPDFLFRAGNGRFSERVAARQPDPRVPTVIENGRIFTASVAGVIDQGVVVIGDDGRIAAVGRRGTANVPAGAARWPVEGRAVLPGPIDMHAHVLCGTDAEAREGLNTRTVTDQTLRAVNNARRCIQAGITTVRDAGARSDGIFKIKQAIDQGIVLGPRIFPSGQAITMSGGHGWNAAAVEADGPDEVRKAARQQLKAGALCIKLMVTGGAGTAGERITDLQFSVDELCAGTEEAHKKGRHVLAHVTNSDGVANAIAAGIDSIEHGLVLNEDAVQAMSEHGVYLCPTLEAYERIVRLGPAAGYYDYMVPKAASVLEPHRASFRLALSAGVKMLAGTDAGGHFWQLGDLGDELERMVEAGMTAEAALLSATRTAAECLGWQEDVGALEAGRWGDILIVDGDPMQEIAAVKRVHAVFKGGRLVSRTPAA